MSPHLVEEEHAAVRDLQPALLVARGLRERALDVAEQLDSTRVGARAGMVTGTYEPFGRGVCAA
jgi:hypothetical protein